MFTRDSAVLYLGLAGAILAYIIASPKDISEWSTREYVQLALLGVTWLTGKLQTSPLPHSTEGDAKVTPSGQ